MKDGDIVLLTFVVLSFVIMVVLIVILCHMGYQKYNTTLPSRLEVANIVGPTSLSNIDRQPRLPPVKVGSIHMPGRYEIVHDPRSTWDRMIRVAPLLCSTTHSFPRLFFQTFKHQLLPPYMAQNMAHNITINPGWVHVYLDDLGAHQFLADVVGDLNLLTAYEKLIPGAFRADLLRLALLYQYGGAYIDISMRLEEPLDNIIAMYPGHDTNLITCVDHGGDGKWIYQALLISRPRNPVLRTILQGIVKQVLDEQFVPGEPLSLTGPMAFGRWLNRHYGYDADKVYQTEHPPPGIGFMQHMAPGRVISTGLNPRIVAYTKYPEAQQERPVGLHYHELFHRGHIFYPNRIEAPAIQDTIRIHSGPQRYVNHIVPMLAFWSEYDRRQALITRQRHVYDVLPTESARRAFFQDTVLHRQLLPVTTTNYDLSVDTADDVTHEIEKSLRSGHFRRCTYSPTFLAIWEAQTQKTIVSSSPHHEPVYHDA